MAFKLFQTTAFGKFLIRYLESFKSGVITKTLDDMMTTHPDLDLTTHESYETQAVATTDDDLMKAVLNPPAFPLLKNLRFSDQLMTFEEMLSSMVDEDEDYQRLTE